MPRFSLATGVFYVIVILLSLYAALRSLMLGDIVGAVVSSLAVVFVLVAVYAQLCRPDR